MGLNFAQPWLKVQTNSHVPSQTIELEEHESMEVLDMDAVGCAPESESNSSSTVSTCCSSSFYTESTMLDHLHARLLHRH